MSKIISQKKDLICIILEDLIDKLNNNLKRDKPDILLIGIFPNEEQYILVIKKIINFHINRFNYSDDLHVRLHVINIFYSLLYQFFSNYNL